MRLLKKITLLLLFLIFSAQNSFSYLKCSGKNIVDSSGNKILLRGMGLGGWFVPEGYQLQIPGFGSPSSIRQKIFDLIGEENANEFYQKYYENYVTEEEIQQIASWGFNSIRLPFNYRILSPEDQPGVYLEEGFQVIDNLLNWCKNNQLYLILDMHCAPGGQNSGNISDSDGIEARLWTESANQDRTIEIWKKIAERYVNEEWIGGYDLINEPVLPQEYNNTHLRSLLMKITQAIREIDQNHIIFIEGNWYATDFTNLTPPFAANLAYSFHKYWSDNDHGSIQQYLNIRNSYSVPLWMGESGENSNTWFYDAIQLFERNNIGWCWWTHKKIGTLTSPYSSPVTPEYQTILNYWKGQGTKPSVEFAKNALLGMAENLKTEYCEFRPGVLKALFQPDFGINATPFTDHKIPGIINCSDYDFGTQNVAYYDKEYQWLSGGSNNGTWNFGWQYRNDGVDIEVCSDSHGAKYNIGWIESMEWITYTVQIEQTGVYEIDLRIASPNSTGKIKLFMDNNEITSIIEVPNTGAWQTWTTISISDVELQTGTSSLKLYFPSGDFNINHLKFRLISTSEDSETNPSTPDGFILHQSYPNPFSVNTKAGNLTTIKFSSESTGEVTLVVYNVLGQNVFQENKILESNGENSFVWDGRDINGNILSGGIYFYAIDYLEGNKSKRQIKKMIVL